MQQRVLVVDIQEQPLPRNQIRAFPCIKLNKCITCKKTNNNNNHCVIKVYVLLALFKAKINAKARVL